MTRKKIRQRLAVGQKHIPQRTCAACRQVRPKRELIRLVRLADSSIAVDTGGKQAGRGTYLCRQEECWQLGLKGNRLEYTLRARLTPENRQRLAGYGKELTEPVPGRGG